MVHEFDSKTYDLMKRALHDIEYMKNLCVKKRVVKPEVALHSIDKRLEQYNEEFEAEVEKWSDSNAKN